MDRNVVFLLLLSILSVSMFWDSRVLADEQASTSVQNPSLPIPSPDAKSSSDPKPVGDEKSSNVKPGESQVPNSSNSSTSAPNESDRVPPPQISRGDEKNDAKVFNRTEPTSPPPAKQTEKEDNAKRREPLSPPPKGEAFPPPEKAPHDTDSDKVGSQASSSQNCSGLSNICRDVKSLVACTLSIQRDSAKWLILVQNEGEESLKANIVLPGSTKNPLKELTIQKHQSERVNVSIGGDTNKIILDAGHGECVLHAEPLDQSGESSLIFHLPSYEKLVTPINGAYFLIFSVVVFGGSWACCLLRKNHRAGAGVAYQELEMSGGSGLEARSGGRDVETADWDESWDDDWDEVSAVKSPGSAKKVSISSNGLTARGSSRDGWENDWDD